MKKNLYFLLIPVGIIIISAFSYSDEVISKLGCSDETVKNSVFDSFFYENLYLPGCDGKYKSIPSNERAAVVNQLFDYIKSYVQSEDFRTKYQVEHENQKPSEPTMEEIPSAEDQNQLMIKGMEEQLNSPYLSDEQKTEIKNSIEVMKQTTSTPEYLEMTKQMVEIQQKTSQEEYEKKLSEYKTELAEWEKLKDINYMLKSRLNAFLELTSSINFEARLVRQNDKWKFEDPTLESKSYEWKKCFRSGRETISTARTCSLNWLKELGQ